MIYPIIPAQQHYSWGSPSLIPKHLGIPNPKQLPMAELWLGTHPRGKSMVTLGDKEVSLEDAVTDDPRYWTGDDQGQLSFLLKVLGIGSPLSIQCHPSSAQARLGYDQEQELGVSLESPQRTYRDPRGKPEIICALTPYTALCGFLPLSEALSRLPMLEDVKDHRSLLQAVFACTPEELRRCTRACQGIDAPWAQLVGELEQRYPGDPGILAPCYLNVVHLQPGEALFLDAGVLHAYVEGLGVEVMGNSDNVIRGGMTDKYIDRKELMRIVRNSEQAVPYVVPREISSGHRVYPVATADFLLHQFREGSHDLKHRELLEIGVVTDGSVLLQDARGDRYTFHRGEAFVIPASCSSYRIESTGEAYLACAGGRV